MRSHSSLFVKTKLLKLKPWRSPSVGWDSWMCQCFPTPDPDIHPALDESKMCQCFPTPDPDIHPALDETAECASVSPHLTLTPSVEWDGVCHHFPHLTLTPFPHTWPWRSPSAGWMRRQCFTISPHLTLMFTQCWIRRQSVPQFPHTWPHCHTCVQVQCYLSLRHLHSSLRDFSKENSHVRKTAIAESNPEVEISTNNYALTPMFWLETKRCPVMTMPI